MADFSFSEASKKFTKKKRSYSKKSIVETGTTDKVRSLDEIVAELAKDPNFKTEEPRANFLTRLGSGLSSLSLAPQIADVTSGKKDISSAVIDYFPQVVDRLAKTFNPKSSQRELDVYNDAASKIVTNLGGDALPKSLKLVADLGVDIGVDPVTYIPFADLFGVGGKVAKGATPVLKSAAGTKTLTKAGARLLDNVFRAADSSLIDDAGGVTRYLDDKLPGLGFRVRDLFSRARYTIPENRLAVIGGRDLSVGGRLPEDLMREFASGIGNLYKKAPQVRGILRSKKLGGVTDDIRKVMFGIDTNFRSGNIAEANRMLGVLNDYLDKGKDALAKGLRGKFPIQLPELPPEQLAKTTDETFDWLLNGKYNGPAEMSVDSARKMAAQDLAETIVNEIIDNNGISKTLNALPTKYANEVAKAIGDTSQLFVGGKRVKPLVDLTKVGEQVRPIIHKAYSTLPAPLRDMFTAAKTGITAAFDNFPVFKDMPVVRESFQKMLNANRGAKDFGESVLKYFNRQFATLTKAKGYTPEDIISAVEYVGRPEWRGKILENTPKVAELLKDSEVAPLINTITQLFNESDTLGLLGVDELTGYFARMVDKTDAATMDALRKAGLIKSPKRMMGGFAKERILDMPFTEAQKVLAKAGGKYKTDLSYILANYATRMSQAKNTLSFFASLMDTPLVKLAGEAPAHFVKVSDKTLPFLKGYRVSPEVSGVLEKIVSVTQGKYSPKGVLQIFDKVSSLFKESVTVYFPAFHTRNLMSNLFNIMVSGESPAKIPKLYGKSLDIMKYGKMLDEGKDVSAFGKKVLISIGERKYTVSELHELVRAQGVHGGQIQEAVQQGTGLSQKLGGAMGAFRTKAQDIGRGVEDTSRVTLFLSGLERGATPTNAAGMVKKFLFNYDELTDFEKNVMRRLIPFYSYLRFNTELQLTLMLQDPKMYSKLLKVGNALAGSEGDGGDVLPDWTKQTLGLDLTGIVPNQSGEIIFSPGLGLPPEQLNNIFGRTPRETGENIIGMTNPLIKIPLEQTFDYNVFKGKKISEDTDGTTYKNAPAWVKKVIGYQEKEVEMKNRDGKKITVTKYLVDPQKKYYINSVLGRITSTSMRGFDFASAVESGNANWSDLLPLFTGVKTYKFNIEEERAKRENEKKRRILDKLLKEGYGKQYTGTSIDAEGRKQIIDKYLQ